MFSHRVFKPNDESTNLTVAQARAKERIDLINKECSKLIGLLDEEALLDEAEDFLRDGSNKESLSTVQALVISKVTAYIKIFLESDRYSRESISLNQLREELKKEPFSLYVIREQYETLKASLKVSTVQLNARLLDDNCRIVREQSTQDEAACHCIIS